MHRPITKADISRFHAAAKFIEYDMEEAYWTVRERFGADIAGALLVSALRKHFGSLETFPARDEVVMKVDKYLHDKKLLEP